MNMVLGICSVLVTVAEKRLALYVTISTSGYDGWLQQRDCHGIDTVWTRRAARDCSGVDAKGVKSRVGLTPYKPLHVPDVYRVKFGGSAESSTENFAPGNPSHRSRWTKILLSLS